MKNIIKNTSKNQKEETLKTLIKLYSDYDTYFTHHFSPVWGFVDGLSKNGYKKKLKEMDLILKGDKHPFFE